MNIEWRVVGAIALAGGGVGFGCDYAPAEDADATNESSEPTEQAATADPTSVLETWPSDLPPYAKEMYLASMGAPLPPLIGRQETPRFVQQLEIDRDSSGFVGNYQPKGRIETATNAFFQPLGTNGRTCFTCHQMGSGMSVSARNIRARLYKSHGTDPIFAPVDGANCPNVTSSRPLSSSGFGSSYHRKMGQFIASRSLLLEKGLFRIPLPVPANAEYTIEVVSDPTTCNVDPKYNTTTSGARIVSVFRRPLISSNLNFKTNVISFGGPPSPLTNIMADGREPTLFTQAIDATLGHAQATKVPTQEQVDQIVAFETGIFTAQVYDDDVGLLDIRGGKGGPITLSTHAADAPAFGVPAFDEFAAWETVTGRAAERRQSVARGQKLFQGQGGADATRGQFTMSNVAGFNDAIGVPALAGQSCATCHNFAHGGSDVLLRSQRDIGTGGHGVVIGGPALSKDLPIFKLTCPAGSFLWDPTLTTVLTNDPAKALVSGLCRDIGARTVPSLRGVASHEPFFIDGSAATLRDLVNVYDKRFSIGFTEPEKDDLVHFLEAL